MRRESLMVHIDSCQVMPPDIPISKVSLLNVTTSPVSGSAPTVLSGVLANPSTRRCSHIVRFSSYPILVVAVAASDYADLRALHCQLIYTRTYSFTSVRNVRLILLHPNLSLFTFSRPRTISCCHIALAAPRMTHKPLLSSQTSRLTPVLTACAAFPLRTLPSSATCSS